MKTAQSVSFLRCRVRSFELLAIAMLPRWSVAGQSFGGVPQAKAWCWRHFFLQVVWACGQHWHRTICGHSLIPILSAVCLAPLLGLHFYGDAACPYAKPHMCALPSQLLHSGWYTVAHLCACDALNISLLTAGEAWTITAHRLGASGLRVEFWAPASKDHLCQ